MDCIITQKRVNCLADNIKKLYFWYTKTPQNSFENYM